MPFTIKALVLSLFSAKFYREVAHNQKGIGFKFLALISFIVTIYTSVSLYTFIEISHKQDIDDFITGLPVITLEKEGGISIDQPSPYVMGDEGDDFIIIDTENYNSASADTILAMMKEKEIEVFVTKNNLYMNKNQNETRIYDLSDKRDESYVVTHEIIREYGEKIKTYAFPFIILMIFGGVFVYKMLQMVLYSLVGFVINSMRKVKLENNSIHRISSYAIWPSMLVGIILGQAGLEFYTWSSILITILYILYGMKSATAAK